MKKIPVLFFLFFAHSAIAQKSDWNGKQAAVVLTYDDGLNIDLAHVVPALDSFGLKGTFYISDHFNGLAAQINRWRRAAAKGHELANHTIWHPCEGGRAGREFVKDYDLRFYTVKRMVDEVRSMNNFLKAVDGEGSRTFAYPCGDAKIGDTAYIDFLKADFIAARSVKEEMPGVDSVNLYYLPGYMMNGHTGHQMIALVKEALKKKALLVFLFHGVGGEHGLNVSRAAHRQLLKFLQQQKATVWVPTVRQLAQHLAQSKKKK